MRIFDFLPCAGAEAGRIFSFFSWARSNCFRGSNCAAKEISRLEHESADGYNLTRREHSLAARRDFFSSPGSSPSSFYSPPPLPQPHPLFHRAGPALRERAPRPSLRLNRLRPSSALLGPSRNRQAEVAAERGIPLSSRAARGICFFVKLRKKADSSGKPALRNDRFGVFPRPVSLPT